MLQFQAVDAGGIGNLNIIMVVVVVELVYDTDAERVGVAKGAVVNPGHIEVADETEVAFGFEDGINFYKAITKIFPVAAVVRYFFPGSEMAVLVFQRNRPCIMQQVVVANGQVNFTTMRLEVNPQSVADRIHGLLSRRFVTFVFFSVVIVFGEFHGAEVSKKCC